MENIYIYIEQQRNELRWIYRKYIYTSLAHKEREREAGAIRKCVYIDIYI